MSNPNLSAFCPSCPVRINGDCEGEMSKSAPLQQAADHIDIMNTAVGDLRLVTDVWAVTDQDERDEIKNDVDEAAAECSQAILESLGNLSEPETADDVLLRVDLGACATRIANGGCERTTHFRDTL